MAKRILPIVVVAVALVGALVLRESGSHAQAQGDKRSACGPDAGIWPRELGLQRTRALTLCLLNEVRVRHQLAPLRPEERLELAAQRYAADMIERRFFDHVDPGGLDPHARILMAGYPALNAWTGENLAWGTGPEGSPIEIVDTWMHSPGHRENILRATFTEIGIGVEFDLPKPIADADPGATYVTTFGGPPTR
ncbi:MAG: hypothetical protein QOH58_2694 [Thermoleophilaceae bacterium]|nr:hypothetical protein [Thermoleophilaceae bacterium]